MTQTASAPRQARKSSASRASARSALVDRYFELQPHLQRRFSAAVHRELRDELQSVTLHQLGVLFQLRSTTLTMRELARELDVSESAATAVTDRLVRQGLVDRLDDPADRRVVRLEISKSGAALVEQLHDAARRKTASLLSALDDAQLVQLVSIMETLDAAASDLVDGGKVTKYSS